MRRSNIICRAVISSNFLRDPAQGRTFDEALQEHKAAGADFASNLTSEFVSLQVQLMKYRVVRLRDELVHLRSHPADGIPSLSAIPLYIITLAFFYWLGQGIGRCDFCELAVPPTEVKPNAKQ